MVIVDNCCFCIDIETGVMVLGTLACFGIINDIFHFQELRMILEVLLFISFLVMLANNKSCTRLLFLFAYVLHYIGQLVIVLFIADRESGGLDLEKISQNSCDAMTLEDRASFEQKKGVECLVAMKKYHN